MFVLSLTWLGVGLVVGLLALGARLRPPAWGRYGWLILLGCGAAAGVAGGWVGVLVLGRYFGTATALWVAVLVVVAAPWLAHRHSWARRRSSAT